MIITAHYARSQAVSCKCKWCSQTIILQMHPCAMIRSVLALLPARTAAKTAAVHKRLLSTKLADVELTTSRFKNSNLKRGPFAVLQEEDIIQFEKILDKQRVITDESEVLSYNVDWLRMVRGGGKVVLKPKTTAEVSEILKYCHRGNLAVVPQAGNTGIVGGGTPVFDEIVLSTSLMNSIVSFDEVSGILVCEAGCVLETLTNHLEEKYGWTMPLDLGAKGSCQIGGNIATNAGGLRVVRYGSLHSTVLGVEAVLADGTILDCMSTMKKDNTGYDLKHLFIGSEGTLGIVTQVAIQCPIKPKSVNCTILGLNSFQNVIESLKLARRDLNEIISSFEYMDLETMKVVTGKLGLKWVLPEYPFYVLLEVAGSNEDHDNQKLENYLDLLMKQEIVKDGIVASSENDRKAIWELRERAAEALNKDSFFYSYDVSIPVEKFEEIIIDLRERLGPVATTCCGFGHLGDGNIHVNVTTPTFDNEVLKRIEPFLYEWVQKYKGSISSEHGIGFKKKQFLPYSKPDQTIQVMKQIKHLFDPKGILNPYKVLP